MMGISGMVGMSGILGIVSSTTRDSKGSRLVWSRGELPVRRNEETNKFSGIYSLSNSEQINTIKMILSYIGNKLTD